MPNVTHFVRNERHLTDPFIYFQINSHIAYEASVVFKYRSDSNAPRFTKDLSGKPRYSIGEHFKSVINWFYLKRLYASELKGVLHFLKQQQSDILHFHYGTDAYIYSDVMRLYPAPSVVSFYGYDATSVVNEFHGLGKRILRKGAFEHARLILAMSDDMKKDLITLGCPAEKIKVHYHGVSTNYFSRIYRTYDSVDTVNFTILANLNPKKGHIMLLSAFLKVLKESKVKVSLTIAGEGPEANVIRNFVHENALLPHVVFKPAFKHCSPEMDVLMSNADVFVHPSVVAKNGDKEGIPGTIVEAMASGLPVISTFHAGIPSVIEDGATGFLVNEWDIDALAQKMLLLAENAALRERIGRAAKTFAIEHLDIRKKAVELEEIYNSLMNKNYLKTSF